MRVLVGYDGSPAASAAISAGTQVLPTVSAWVANLWTPPFADDALRRRLWMGAGRLDEFVEAVEREGEREASKVAAMGATLARAAGWDAEPLVKQTYAGEGPQLAELAEELDADVVLVGSRGLGGARAVLGSVSDAVVHFASRPVLVIPHPLLTTESAALAAGPVLIGDDGSADARAAVDAAGRLFPTRSLVLVTVEDDQVPDDMTGVAQPEVEQTRLHVPARHGPPGRAVAGALAGCAQQQRAAVLAVGSRGRSAAREILLGSVAMATLHHTHRPVLVVPTAGRSQPVQGEPASGR